MSVDLGSYVRAAATAGDLVVQPRMGMSRPEDMAAGLRAVAAAAPRTVGTITVDSYTRVGDHERAAEAARSGLDVNGFPIVAHGPSVVARLRDACPDIPIQVRHGSAQPLRIFRTLAAAGLSASEGGPVSYCLPYGRTPLAESVANWRDATEELADRCRQAGRRAHLETFGGCLLGQLCPPSLLVAMSILEGLFFVRHGVRSISFSYAQQTNVHQDVAAMSALRRLAAELLPPAVDWHVVLYTYMGFFPATPAGAGLLLDRSASLAVAGGAHRLVVKTAVEAFRVPTVAENVAALRRAAATAARTAAGPDRLADPAPEDDEVLREARALCAAVLGLHDDLGTALLRAFELGLLDVPFCIHADNRGLTRATIDDQGRLRWSSTGRLPLPAGAVASGAPVTAFRLLSMLRHTADAFDRAALADRQGTDRETSVGERTPAALPAAPDAPAASPAAPAASAASAAAPGVRVGDAAAPDLSAGGEAVAAPAAASTAGSGPDAWRIVVVGTGPRGLSVLERLAARLRDAHLDRPVEVVAVDASHVGPGRVWRPNQPRWLLMNTPAGEVTMFSGPPDDQPTRPGSGPSLMQWWRTFDPASTADSYAPRAVFGHYLRYVLNRIERSLDGVAGLHRVYARVDDFTRAADGRYRLRLDDGQSLVADRVVLTVGHTLPALPADQRVFADFAAGRPELRFIRGDSAADLPLADIAPASTVAVIGLGLSFYDVVAGLTVGRGGRFVTGRDGLRYEPSGREPLIVAGSRTGVPLQARGRNQKPADHRYRPRLFTRERVAELRRGGPLRFDSAVLPWLMAEVELVYLATEVRRRFGAEIAERFLREVAGGAAPRRRDGLHAREDLRLLASRYDVDHLPAVDLEGWAAPFRNRVFPDPASFGAALRALLRRDLRLAEEGNVDGPVKACLDVIRDVRGVLRTAVEFGGLTPDSYHEEFLGRFVPMASNLSTGPPRERVAELLALLDSGLVRVVGPRATYAVDDRVGRFAVRSEVVGGSRVSADVLLDARVPTPDLRGEGGLLGRLRDTGLVTGARSGAGRHRRGGAAVTPSPYHPIRRDGRPERGVYLLGIPSEGDRWFTQVGSGRPGPWGEFTADADAIAADALRGAGIAPTPGPTAGVGTGRPASSYAMSGPVPATDEGGVQP